MALENTHEATLRFSVTPDFEIYIEFGIMVATLLNKKGPR